MYRGKWLVMDVDGTIVPTPTKSGGHYLPLDQSPCLAPLSKWMQNGGSLCVVSTAGRRLFRQVHAPLRPFLVGAAAGKLLLCAFSGSALYSSDSTSGEMCENADYRSHAVAGGTTLQPAALPAIEALCMTIVHRFFAAAAAEESGPRLISLLSKKYHEPYAALAQQYRQVGPNKFRDEILTAENAKVYGRYLSATDDAIIDVQWVVGAVPPVAAQLSVLGIPLSRANDFITPTDIEMFQQLGVRCKLQPNSFVICPTGIDKATAMNWLAEHGAPEFELQRAIAFGDVPHDIDLPLTQYPPMPFVSLSLTPEKNPPGVFHVGYEEEGTAAFLGALLAALDPADAHHPSNQRPWIGSELVEECCHAARAQLDAAHGKATAGKPSSPL